MRDNDSAERLQVIFINSAGANADKHFEKSVEALYVREEFLRINAAGIATVEVMPDIEQPCCALSQKAGTHA